MALLDVRDLKIAFYDTTPPTEVVKGISFSLEEGETLGIVGESGSGKTQTALSILQLLKENSAVSGGEILYEGSSVAHASSQDLQRIRGKEISMIFQEPMTSLNPVMKIGRQVGENLELHTELTREEIRERSAQALEQVGLSEPEELLERYPHELSGGMRQRVMIAMALSCNPELLIADEPTTALDVTIQAQIIKLIKDLQKEFGYTIVFITHDLGVIADMCDEIIVMYAGRICERGTVDEIFYNPKHEYTKGLLRSIPKLDSRNQRLIPIAGSPVDLTSMPAGCAFASRCDCAMKICLTDLPEELPINEDHRAACWMNVKHVYDEARKEGAAQ